MKAGSSSNLRMQRVSLITAVVLFGIKLVAYGLTGSNAILTDALEGLVNVVAAGMGLYSLYLSAQPRDTNHPYGHGKIEFVSAGIEGTLILIAGLYVIGKAAYNLAYPIRLYQLDVGLVLVAVAGVINYVLGKRLIRQGKAEHSPALQAGGKHLLTDAWSSVGLITGLVLMIVSGVYWIDNVIAIAFGAFIVLSGWKIVRRSLAGIMDEADSELLAEVVAILNRERPSNWIDIHNLRVQKYGSRLHIDAHLTLPWYYDIRQMHDEVEAVDELINNYFGNRVELFIHVDPCISRSCRVCALENCSVRQQAFAKRVEWNMENVVKNQKHYLDSI